MNKLLLLADLAVAPAFGDDYCAWLLSLLRLAKNLGPKDLHAQAEVRKADSEGSGHSNRSRRATSRHPIRSGRPLNWVCIYRGNSPRCPDRELRRTLTLVEKIPRCSSAPTFPIGLWSTRSMTSTSRQPSGSIRNRICFGRGDDGSDVGHPMPHLRRRFGASRRGRWKFGARSAMD